MLRLNFSFKSIISWIFDSSLLAPVLNIFFLEIVEAFALYNYNSFEFNNSNENPRIVQVII